MPFCRQLKFSRIWQHFYQVCRRKKSSNAEKPGTNTCNGEYGNEVVEHDDDVTISGNNIEVNGRKASDDTKPNDEKEVIVVQPEPIVVTPAPTPDETHFLDWLFRILVPIIYSTFCIVYFGAYLGARRDLSDYKI